MNNENFPIFRSALELCVYVETIVKGFDKYHKYTIGEDMKILIHIMSCRHSELDTSYKLSSF